MKLIFIHGRDQQGKDPSELKKFWIDSLNKGLVESNRKIPSDVEILFPYYGDVLIDFVRQAESPILHLIKSKGASENVLDDDLLDNVSKDEMAFRYQILSQMLRNAGISEAEANQFYDNNYKEKGPLNWRWVHAILRALDRTGFGLDVIDQFTRDVYVYLVFHETVRETVDRIVLNAFSADSEAVVVGHSLGSVVGYSVLSALPAEIKVKAYITLGSPLGINAVHQQLGSIQNPPTVTSWYNAFDPRDVVALRPLSETPFNFLPKIFNKSDVHNFTDNKHGIEGYLQDSEVANTIYNALL